MSSRENELVEIINRKDAEIKHLRDGLSILADPNSFNSSDGAVSVRVCNFAAGILSTFAGALSDKDQVKP